MSVTQAERDLVSAMSRIVPRETAEKVFQLEVDRLDQIAAGHFDNTCAGDIASTYVMLRILELRARLYGLLDRDRAGAAARLVVSDSGNRKLELEFVLPTHNGARLSLDNEIRPLQPLSSSRPTIDLSANKPTSVPIMPRKYGGQDWMS